MSNRLLRRCTTIKYPKDAHPGFLAYVRSSKPSNNYYRSRNFPKYLDERTGEPKHDSYVSLFGDKDNPNES